MLVGVPLSPLLLLPPSPPLLKAAEDDAEASLATDAETEFMRQTFPAVLAADNASSRAMAFPPPPPPLLLLLLLLLLPPPSLPIPPI
jgi:hypothetical protein